VPSNLRCHDEPGHIHFWTISCYRRLGFFHIDPMKQIVIDALRLLQQRFRVCLVGYVVMPEHVHVVLLPHPCGSPDPLPISQLLNAFKQHVGFHGKACLRDYWRAHGQLWSTPLNDWARAKFGEQHLWNTRGHDFNIDRERTLCEKLEYCHKNPDTRELVNHTGEWPWSSYGFYEPGDRNMLATDWHGRWPITW